MKVTVGCRGCGQRFVAAERLIGKTTLCPNCGDAIDVKAPADDGTDKVELRCGCGKRYLADATKADLRNYCPECGGELSAVARFTDRKTQTRRRSVTLTEAQLFGLGIGGFYTFMREESFDELLVPGDAQESAEALEHGYRVTGPHVLPHTLEWLFHEGHSLNCASNCQDIREGLIDLSDATCEPAVKFIARNLDVMEKSQLKAWDLSRLVNVARWGHTAGYLDEAAAWSWINRASRKAQLKFPSWEAFGKNFLLGYDYWCLAVEAMDPLDMSRCYSWLLSNPKSPWQRVQWYSNLTMG